LKSLFSLIKRGVMGTLPQREPKHLQNYLNEFEFRWNTRKLDDGSALRRQFGRRTVKRLSTASRWTTRRTCRGRGKMDAPF
jgi:hypothetical protein